MKKLLLSVLLIFIGLLAGLIVGSITAGYGGGVAGICIYNDIAIHTKTITKEQSLIIAKGFAERIKSDKKDLQWLFENTDVEDSDNCAQFFETFKNELKVKAQEDK